VLDICKPVVLMGNQHCHNSEEPSICAKCVENPAKMQPAKLSKWAGCVFWCDVLVGDACLR